MKLKMAQQLPSMVTGGEGKRKTVWVVLHACSSVRSKAAGIKLWNLHYAVVSRPVAVKVLFETRRAIGLGKGINGVVVSGSRRMAGI